MGTDKEEVLGKGIFESILEQMNANIFIMDAQTGIIVFMNEMMKSSFEKVVQARGNRAGLYYHGRIVDAFERKDDEAAEKIMDEHMKE